MPQSNREAAVELKNRILDGRLTSKRVAAQVGCSESWLSRRLSGAAGMEIDDYTQINAAIDQLLETQAA